ncbi:MAG: hypothetical protein HFE79_04540 [Ruminiclostridium sp.]|nr:hypothetical protein [Ruminiclostridium sp.]
MIDPNEAVQAFKEKFSKMSYDEREQYLKKMGFSFGEEFEKDDLLSHMTKPSFRTIERPSYASLRKQSEEKTIDDNKTKVEA